MPVSFYFPETARYFGEYCVSAREGTALTMPDWFWAQWTRELREGDAHAEYSAWAAVCSAALFPYGRCVFHATAISRDNGAWLIAGPPGVGKTTVAGLLRDMRPGEIGVISGDRPVLRRNDDGTMTVFPSPWNGKEDWCGAPAAKLAGTVLLRRGEANAIQPLTPGKAAARTYTAVFQTAADADMLRQAAVMTEAVLNAAPVLDLASADPAGAAALLYDHITGGVRNDV